MTRNVDIATVEGFGEEWSRFNQSGSDDALEEVFGQYFAIFPWKQLATDAVGFDAGCGSGRWARLVAPRVAKLYCVDASEKALDVARHNLSAMRNCVCVLS